MIVYITGRERRKLAQGVQEESGEDQDNEEQEENEDEEPPITERNITERNNQVCVAAVCDVWYIYIKYLLLFNMFFVSMSLYHDLIKSLTSANKLVFCQKENNNISVTSVFH